MAFFAPIFLSLGLLSVGDASTRTVVDDFFDSQGVRIHYRVEGRGEPVLMIHGFAANIPAQWDLPGVTSALAPSYHLIALDNRGHGRSAKPHDPQKYGMEMVDDAIRLLDHLKVKKAHVVGYSMGAMIAGKLMVTHPERVLTLTLGGAGVARESSDRKLYEELSESLEKEKSIGPLLNRLTPAGRPKLTREQINTTNKLLQATNDVKALSAVVRSWKDLIVSDDVLRANKIPVLGLVGDRDPLRDWVEDLKGVLTNYQIVLVADSDHMNAFTKPAFSQAIKTFLAQHRENRE